MICTKGKIRFPHDLWMLALLIIVSFGGVIQVVTQCSSPTNGCSLELCIPFPLLLRTNNMHVTVSSYTSHISRYICRQRPRFPRNGSLLLIGQFKERNAELEWAALSWEEHCVTTLITAAKETRNITASFKHFYNICTIIILGSFSFENTLMVMVVSRTSLSNS